MKSENKQSRNNSLGDAVKKKTRKEQPAHKKLRSEYKKQKAAKHQVFAVTLLLLLVYFWIYIIAWLSSSSIDLTASIKATSGGYSLRYDACTIDLAKFDEVPSVGDKVYVDKDLEIKKNKRKCVEMKVSDVDDNVVRLEFVTTGIPDFISTNDYLVLIKKHSLDDVSVSKVMITGKIVTGRFLLSKISFPY